MSVFHIVARGIKNISIEDIDKRWVTFTYKEIAILESFGVKFVKYSISSSGEIKIVNNGKLNLSGNLYALSSVVGSTVLIRDMDTLDMVSWGLGKVAQFLAEGRQIQGLTFVQGAVLGSGLESDNRESTFMTLCTGARGYIRKGRLLRVTLPEAVFTPGDYCSEILTHSMVTLYSSGYIVRFDHRIKVLEGGWLVKMSNNTKVICDLREAVSDEILDVLLHSAVTMTGYDSEYTAYANCILTYAPVKNKVSVEVEQRFLSRYKDELLEGILEAEVDNKWVEYRKGILDMSRSNSISTVRAEAYANLSAVLAKGGLSGVNVDDLALAFFSTPSAVIYVASGGHDTDIIEAVLNKIS